MISGSTAIKYWFYDFPRNPKDIDIIIDINSTLNQEFFKKKYYNTKVEFLLNPIIFKHRRKRNLSTDVYTYLEPDELITLKVSHLFWDLPNKSWEKHIWDVQFLKEKGCKIIPELFWDLFYYWETIHGKRKASQLNMSAKEFFTNNIKFPFEHDFLHEVLVTHPYFLEKTPTYKKILKENQEVDVCMNKFINLSELDKFNVVFEEVAVMSIERFPKEMHFKAMYEKMLKKFIISHCKIEEGIWIIENHKKLITNIPFNFKSFIYNKIC